MAYNTASHSYDLDLGPELLRRFARLEQDRQPYDQVWDEITEYILPSRGTYTYQKGSQDAERKSRKRLDSTATYAHRALTARVIGEFTNSGSRWFEYRATDPEIDKIYEVRSFLQKMSDKAYQRLNASSFLLAHTEVTSDWCGYGTACMLEEDKGKDGIVRTSIPPAQIWFSENKDGDVDCVYRKYNLTYKQLCEEFGFSVIPDDIHLAYEETPHEKLELLHVVEPNSGYLPGKKAAKFFRFKGIYVLKKTGTTLRIGYYKRKPYIVARFWKRTDEVYGGSPGMDALADIRLLNMMTDVGLRGLQLSVAPPQGLAHDSVISPLKLTPYGINYGAISADGKRLVTNLLEGSLPLKDLAEWMEATKQQIRAAFFVDPLMNRETSIRTAAEVQKRSGEETTGLAPFLSRFDVEYLSVVLDTELDHILTYENKLPIPKELKGLGVRIEYTGPLAKTQRAQELNNNLQFAQIAQTVGGVDPSLMQNVDWNAWLRNVAELLGVPMDNINSPEYMAELAAKSEQQQQTAMMLEAAKGAASTVTDAAKAGLINRQDLGLPATPEGI